MTQNNSASRATARFGYWAALGTGVLTTIAFGMAIMTPPLSGSFCVEGCFEYPYLNIAARFPRDYYWMYPAIVATLFYLAMMVAIHGRAAAERRMFSLLGLLLATMASLVLVGDYFLQLAVMQPSILAGESDGLSLLTQYNPHGLFIGLEELGYLLMSVSLACAAPALSANTRLERAVRWLFAGGLLVNLATLLAIALQFGHERGYIFEIAVITVNWLVVIVASFMLTAVFHREAA